MVEFKTQYGRMEIDSALVVSVELDGNLTVITEYDGGDAFRYVVSDSYSEAMRKLGRNV